MRPEAVAAPYAAGLSRWHGSCFSGPRKREAARASTAGRRQVADKTNGVGDGEPERDERVVESQPVHIIPSGIEVRCGLCGTTYQLSKHTRLQDLRAFAEIHAHD